MTNTTTNIAFQKYPAYKDSGVEWLREIPEGWKVRKLLGLSHFVRGNSSFGKDDLLNTGKYVALQYGKSYQINEVDEKYKFYVNDEYYKGSQIVNYGDTIFISTSETIEDLGHSVFYKRNDLGLIGGEQMLLKPKIDTVNSKYLYYLSKVISKELRKFATGIKVFRFNIADLKTINSPVPPLPEQTAIATFLDVKTAKIDRAITQKEQLINLLKERKQIMIQDLVTGKKVWNEKEQAWMKPEKVKDSGVEWIGDVPEEWKVKKLFGVSRFIRGNSTFSKDELLSSGEYVALQYGKTYKVAEVNDNYQFYVNSEFYKDSQVVNYGDTIIISTSETIDDLGHSAYYNRKELGLLGGEQMMMKPNMDEVNGLFLYYSSKVFSKELRKYATGIKVYRFNINDLKTVKIAIPSIQDQSTIVSHIEAQSAKIDKAIKLQEQQIEKLKELKSTLIDGAVTGKIKVS